MNDEPDTAVEADPHRGVIFSEVIFTSFDFEEPVFVFAETYDDRPDWNSAIYLDEARARDLVAQAIAVLDGPAEGLDVLGEGR